MEDIDTTKDFSSYTDEELMQEVIGNNADLCFIDCCLAELQGVLVEA
ncbi:MAG: hypothetical protein SNG79_05740 [Rikenellaceae bacterium]